MTKELLGMARNIFTAGGLPLAQRTGSHALYYAGNIDGRSEIISFLEGIQDFLNSQIAMAKAQGLIPDYGAEERLRREEAGESPDV